METGTGWNQFKGKETPSTVEIHELFFKAVSKNTNVLDFGCAWGRVAFQLQKLGYNVTGFDLNKNAIDTAIQLAKSYENHGGKVKFDEANAMDLPYPDGFIRCMYYTSISYHNNLTLRQDKSFIRGTPGFKKEWNFIPRRFWIKLEKFTLSRNV